MFKTTTILEGFLKPVVTAAVFGGVLSSASVAQAAEAVALRISTSAPPTEILVQSMNIFKLALDYSAPGEFDVSLHPGGTLFKQGTDIAAMQRGNLEMNVISTFDVAKIIKEYSIYNTGYLFESYDHMKRVWGSELGREYRARVDEEMGIHILSDCYLGTREVAINQVRNVKTPEDLKGIKLRMPGLPDFIRLGKGLGVDPTPMALTEVYLAMKSGAVDGQDNPLTVTYTTKLNEVTKEVVMTDHAIQNVFYAIAKPVFDNLGADQQVKVEAAAAAACAWNDRMRIADEARLRKVFADDGIVISHPDLAAFSASMAAVYAAEDVAKDWPQGLMDAIKALR